MISNGPSYFDCGSCFTNFYLQPVSRVDDGDYNVILVLQQPYIDYFALSETLPAIRTHAFLWVQVILLFLPLFQDRNIFFRHCLRRRIHTFRDLFGDWLLLACEIFLLKFAKCSSRVRPIMMISSR